ncbi:MULTISPECIES: TolC family protein [Shimia]|uniref:TolC family protein n=1 Tax=Shimia TaxID=573139 RepID=UPI001FB3A670|nr:MULTISPECIES: TolC family protein [Shimia]MDV4145682.1 TolC family protein [Shimia sp. FJ5]
MGASTSMRNSAIHIALLVKRVFFGFFIFAVLAPATAQAQMSLQEAVLKAIAREPGIEALRQEVAVKAVDIEAARDAYFPTIGLSGETSTTNSNGPGVTLTVSQVLFDWGQIRHEIAAKTQIRIQAMADLKQAIEELTFEVAGYFLDVEVMAQKIRRTKTYMTFAYRIAEQAEERSKARLSDVSEVARARLEITRAEDQLSQLLANREIALAQLEFLVGQRLGGTLTPPELRFDRRFNTADQIRTAIYASPDYLAAKSAVAEAEAGVKQAKVARFPKIELQAQGRVDLNGGRTQTALGLTAGVDLSSRGFGQRRIQAAQLELKGAQSEVAAVERNLLNSGQSALKRLGLLRRSEKSRSIQLIDAEKVLETYEKQFVAGRKELLDILTTGRDLYDAQIDEIDTYDERKRTEYEAAKDLGVLGTLLLSKRTSRQN